MTESKPNDNKPNYFVIGFLVLIILICIGVIFYLVFKPRCPECPKCVKCPERQCRGIDPINYDIVGNELKIGQVLYPCQAIRTDNTSSSFMIQDNGDINFIRFSNEHGISRSLISLGRLSNATLKSADSFVLTFDDGNTRDIFKDDNRFKENLKEAKLLNITTDNSISN